MDFEGAAARLARDQSKLRGRNRGSAPISQKAKREAELRRKQQQRVVAERQRKQRQKDHQEQYMRVCERGLAVRSLGSQAFQATSIHGVGDKIALPPRILELLTTAADVKHSGASPWTFRIGILNPDYTFPASPLVQRLQPSNEDDDDTQDDDDDDDQQTQHHQAYLDELNHKYVAYTHGTVVEFTQDEGYVGLPEAIAKALIAQAEQKNLSHLLPVKRTVDPAAAAASKAANQASDDSSVANQPKDDADNNNMAPTPDENIDTTTAMDEDDEQTPGHLAWGAFDIPSVPIEVSLVQLPKGTDCVLTPTKEAIAHGFYGLKDIKLVLEQSLIRTRAVLSVHDQIATWHRGVQYNLNVTQVQPALYKAVLCINTDINVEFGAPPTDATPAGVAVVEEAVMETLEETKTKSEPSSGYTLSGSRPVAQRTSVTSSPPTSIAVTELLPEPPADQTENVCTIQIRADGNRGGRRRFDVTKATVRDLFGFAATVTSAASFRLVTRFPRRVLVQDDMTATTLKTAGLQAGQELFLVETAEMGC